MFISIENVTEKKNKGQTYFTFSLFLGYYADGYSKTHGWRYYPSTGTMAAPSRNAGTAKKPRHVATQWLSAKLYEAVLEYVKNYLVSAGLCEEPFESPEQRKETVKKWGEK